MSLEHKHFGSLAETTYCSSWEDSLDLQADLFSDSGNVLGFVGWASKEKKFGFLICFFKSTSATVRVLCIQKTSEWKNCE